MKLYYHTIPDFLRECLQKLMKSDAFNDFVLVGGTALSLQLGHRMSADIDLFIAKDYGTIDLEHVKYALEVNFPYIERLETLNETNPGYTLYIGNSKVENIKLDLFYTDNFIAPVIVQDNLRLASLKDIAAMKLQAIVNSKRKKDFWDIHELLEHFSLKELIQFGLKRNP
jgi:predicted nucleotidyltransferase component of viral defense system